MLHMISTFSLRDPDDLEGFQRAMTRLYTHLADQDLLVRVGAICARSADTPMDSDDERAHALCFTTTFTDQEQCDRAYRYIARKGSEAAIFHAQMMACIADDAVFSCWREMTSFS